MEVLPVWKVLLHWSLCDGRSLFSVAATFVYEQHDRVFFPHQIRMWFQMKCRICVSRDKSIIFLGQISFLHSVIIISSVTSLDDLMKICVWGWKWFFLQLSGQDLVESLLLKGVCYFTVTSLHNSVLQTPHQPKDGCCPLWLPSNCQPRGECHFVYVGLCTIQIAFKFQLCQ